MNKGHYIKSCIYLERRIISRLAISDIDYSRYIDHLVRLKKNRTDSMESYLQYSELQGLVHDDTEGRILKNYISAFPENERKIRETMQNGTDHRLITLPEYHEQIEMKLF